MVAAGEAGGILDDILCGSPRYIEKADALRRKVKAAMIYPSVVLCVALGATTFMLIFIIPTFAKMFTDFGGELPLPTEIVIGMSRLPAPSGTSSAAASSAPVRPFRQRSYATDNGPKAGRRHALKLPVLGDVLLKGAVARFTRTLGTLIASGVPILAGLEITARTAATR